MFQAFYSWKGVRFQKCAQTILFQKQHGAERNDWRVKTKKQTINFYRQNHILRDDADPNYRNITVKPAALFDGKFSEEFLEKCFHSLRKSMIRKRKNMPMEMSLNGSFVKTWIIRSWIKTWLDH